MKERRRDYKKRNKSKIKLQDKEYRKNHRREMNLYINNKYKTDLNFRLLCNLRGQMRSRLKGQKAKKSAHSKELIGCSVDEFKKYIESKFLPGMSWLNYGRKDNRWSIDHIIPCAAFDLNKVENQKKCFHYSNLQPLWNVDQWFKSSRYNGKLIRKIRIF